MIAVAITGPESTGKTQLTNDLANHYNCPWVPEYAREYIAKINRPYTLEDIVIIAKEQQRLIEIEKHKTNNTLFFSDTELLVTYIWSKHAFNTVPEWIESNLLAQHFDLYLLCDVDLPWEYDKQREHPHLREYFFQWYEQELIKRNFPYKKISGLGTNRLQVAIDAVNSLLTNKTIL